MKWTTEKPTKPGDYWAAMVPTGRYTHLPPVFRVLIYDLAGDLRVTTMEREPVFINLRLNDDIWRGAQFMPCEMRPADPFAQVNDHKCLPVNSSRWRAELERLRVAEVAP